MSKLKFWSRREKVALVACVVAVCVVFLGVFVMREPSREPMPERLRLALYTAPTNSHGVTQSNEVPVRSARKPRNGIGRLSWHEYGFICYLRGLRVQFWQREDNIWVCNSDPV